MSDPSTSKEATLARFIELTRVDRLEALRFLHQAHWDEGNALDAFLAQQGEAVVPVQAALVQGPQWVAPMTQRQQPSIGLFPSHVNSAPQWQPPLQQAYGGQAYTVAVGGPGGSTGGFNNGLHNQAPLYNEGYQFAPSYAPSYAPYAPSYADAPAPGQVTQMAQMTAPARPVNDEKWVNTQRLKKELTDTIVGGWKNIKRYPPSDTFHKLFNKQGMQLNPLHMNVWGARIVDAVVSEIGRQQDVEVRQAGRVRVFRIHPHLSFVIIPSVVAPFALLHPL